MTRKRIEEDREETDAKVSGLGKFKVDYFEVSEDGLHNLLSQKMGTTKADLRYIIRNRVVPAVIWVVETERV